MSIYKRALREFDASALTGAYQDIGNIIEFPVQKVAFTNTSDVDVYITDQTTNEDFRIPAGGTLSIGEGLFNNNGSSTKFIFSANTTLKIKQATASGTGNIIIHLLG